MGRHVMIYDIAINFNRQILFIQNILRFVLALVCLNASFAHHEPVYYTVYRKPQTLAV